MKAFFEFFVRRHLFANLFTLIVLLLGASSLLTIQRDSYPTVDFGELAIQTVYPGASPEDVELKVTNKIEEELDAVTGLDYYVSYSIEDLSFIRVRIDPNDPDQEKVKRDIRDAVDRVTELPSEVDESPLITEFNTAVFPIIEVGIAGDIPYRDLRERARRFEKKLEQVPGVSRVDRFGYRDREVKIEVDPDRINALEIPLRDVIAAIRGRNVRSTGGSFESYTSERNIVTLAQFQDPREVGEVVVRSTFEGPLIKVNDFAAIRDDYKEEKIISRINGVPAISFIAYKSENADIVRTVDAIKRLVEQEREHMPEGIDLLYSNDTSRYVRTRFGIVASNGAIGLALVLILLALFLNIRLAIWVAVGIPVTLLGTVFLLPFFDIYLDSITLTAMILILGIVVDDAIIISESIYQRYEEGMDPIAAGTEGIYRVYKPVLTTILTTFLAFAPMFFMPGMMGKFVFVIPMTVTLALFISMCEALVALPAHIAQALSKRKVDVRRDRKETWFSRIRSRYERFALGMMRFRYLLVLVFVAALAAAFVYAARHIDFVLFPSSGADQVYARVKLPAGASLAATSDKLKEVEQVLLDLGPGELDSFTTRVGIDDLIVQNEIENYAVISISLTPFSERRRNADEIVEDLRDRIEALGGIEEVFFEIDAGGPPVGRPITIRVVGSEDALRTRLAGDVVSFLNTLPGVKDVDRDDKPGKEQFEIIVDYDRLARLGLSVVDVARSVRTAYDGEVVTTVRYGEDDVDFRVQFEPEARGSVEYLGKLAAPNQRGQLIPLASVASFRSAPGPNNYYHYDGERAITIEGDVDKEVITPVEVTRQVLERFNLNRDYPGMRLVVGGEAEETQQSVYDLMVTFGLAIVAIYFLLILLFNSFVQPIMVVLAIPFGLIGVIIAFGAHGEPFGFLAMMGVIGLAGVVVNDSLVLVNHINQLRAEDPQGDLKAVVSRAASDRLRAITMTSLTTIAGLLPLAYGLGGADPYMGPMALALGWGIFFATPLTLVLIPCLFLIGADVRGLADPERWKQAGRRIRTRKKRAPRPNRRTTK